jgi:hypothetical protein
VFVPLFSGERGQFSFFNAPGQGIDVFANRVELLPISSNFLAKVVELFLKPFVHRFHIAAALFHIYGERFESFIYVHSGSILTRATACYPCSSYLSGCNVARPGTFPHPPVSTAL